MTISFARHQFPPAIIQHAVWLYVRFYTLIAAQILIAVLGVYRIVRRAAPPEKHKAAFVVEPPVPVGTEFAAAHSTAA